MALKAENDKLASDLAAPSVGGDTEASRNAALKDLKKSRMEQLKGLGEAIGKLWSELDVPNDKRAAFTARVKATGIRPGSGEVGEAEVRRLRAVKAERQSAELGRVREAVVHHWEVCGYSDDQRDKFLEFKKVRQSVLSAPPHIN